MKYAPPIGQEAQGEEAHYVDGNPELGILGSPVPAAAIEQGQRELLHVIKQAGLTPSGEDLTQLFQAIGKLISNKVPIASKETAGIVKPGAGLQIGEDGTLDVLVSAVLPGTVVAFAGSFGGEGNRHPIPLGSSEPDTSWVLCDGGSDGKGGTVPNLLGRMILGASDAHPAGSTGGSETHEHSLSGTVGATTLSVGQVASHQHVASGYSPTSQAWDLRPGGILAFWNKAETPRSVTTSSAGASNTHTHSLTAPTQPASNMPPYYALAYIMRCA
ncbi:hypothetical protein [uncultured Desulfovibrio sp.]|uniref:hypothetical protein n=1 Tax=uncultured Desulfovibrio sp. TaxID=167968 RepID=UPI002610691E|nr:hypothetical protein [uncultured Desulfovibrio sp.]